VIGNIRVNGIPNCGFMAMASTSYTNCSTFSKKKGPNYLYMIWFAFDNPFYICNFIVHARTKAHCYYFLKYCTGLYSNGDDTTFSCCMQCQTAVRYFLSPCSKLLPGYENSRINHLIKIDPECISDLEFLFDGRKIEWVGSLLRNTGVARSLSE
jgi:hypothetical protein